MATKHKCPNCDSTKFTASAHVVQTWRIDESGNFIETITDCDEVTHRPDDDDIWYCDNCGAEAVIVRE